MLREVQEDGFSLIRQIWGVLWHDPQKTIDELLELGLRKLFDGWESLLRVRLFDQEGLGLGSAEGVLLLGCLLVLFRIVDHPRVVG